MWRQIFALAARRNPNESTVSMFRRNLGADYSRWRDVYLTLRGEYGARTTRAVKEDESSSVMYVSAPIMVDGQIAGLSKRFTALRPRTHKRPLARVRAQVIRPPPPVVVVVDLGEPRTATFDDAAGVGVVDVLKG